MKNTKMGFLLFLILTTFGCGKDKSVDPKSGELVYPARFKIENGLEKSENIKYYMAGDNNTYQEIAVSTSFESSFNTELDSALTYFRSVFEIRQLVLMSDTTVEINFVVVDPNTLMIELDTTFMAASTIDGKKVSVDGFGNGHSLPFFLDEQNENLRLPSSIYKNPYYFDFDFDDNLVEDFMAIADVAIEGVMPQDTFVVTFANIVYKKE